VVVSCRRAWLAIVIGSHPLGLGLELGDLLLELFVLVGSASDTGVLLAAVL
jgi:hypothetical protein